MKKLTVLLLLILMATGCNKSNQLNTSTTTNTEAAYSLNEKCAANAGKFFNDWSAGADQTSLIALDYTNHYNQKLNKCFIVLRYNFWIVQNKELSKTYTMYDVLENKKYAEFGENDRFGQSNSVDPCSVENQTCKSYDEFSGLISSYMNN